MQYDTLGRMVLNNEPNASGPWIYAYNDSGELAGTRDPRGCGENIAHDALGRIIAETYSPCDPSQPPYSAPNLTTGDGTAVFNLYSPTTGLLLSISDRAQQTTLGYDLRGRIVRIKRQLAIPSFEPILTKRYATSRYNKDFSYYASDRVATETSGGDAPELLVNNSSQIALTYTYGGVLQSI